MKLLVVLAFSGLLTSYVQPAAGQGDLLGGLLENPAIQRIVQIIGEDDYLQAFVVTNLWIANPILEVQQNKDLMAAISALTSDRGIQEILEIVGNYTGQSLLKLIPNPSLVLQQAALKLVADRSAVKLVRDILRVVNQRLPGVDTKIKQGLHLGEELASEKAVDEIVNNVIRHVVWYIQGGKFTDITELSLSLVENVLLTTDLSVFGIDARIRLTGHRALQAAKDKRLIRLYNEITEILAKPPSTIQGVAAAIDKILDNEAIALLKTAGMPEEVIKAAEKIPELLRNQMSAESMYSLFTAVNENLVRVRLAAVTNSDEEHDSFAGIPSTLQFLVDSFRSIVNNPMQLLPLLTGLLARETSPMCTADLSDTFRGVSMQEDWAVNMLDSWGKPRTGITYGQTSFPGKYDQCLRVDTVRNNTMDQTAHRLTTNYVRLAFPLPSSLLGQPVGMDPMIVWGICLPSTCSQADASQMAQNIGQLISLNISSQIVSHDRFREDKNAVITAGVYITITFIIVLLSIIDWLVVSRINIQRTEAKPTTNGVHLTDGESQEKRVSFAAQIEASIWVKLIQALSLYSNVPKLLNTEERSGSLAFLNGLRFLSMAYVILGHTYVFIAVGSGPGEPAISANSLMLFMEKLKSVEFHMILAGTYAVDAFFLMSGFLVTYLFVKKFEKIRESGKSIVKPFFLGLPYHYYLHRYLRLTPLYLVFIFFSAYLFPYVGSGPYWIQNIGATCRTNWWHNILYLNNFLSANPSEMCIPWSWYLANDMQFYIVAPIFIAALIFLPAFGALLLWLVIIGSSALAGYFTWYHFGPMSRANPLAVGDFENVYVKPYTRFHVYGIGMFCGYLLAKHKKSLQMNWFIAILGWIVSLALGLLVVFVPVDRDCNGCFWSDNVLIVWEALHRPLFGICLAWVIIACYIGRGGVVNNLLSWKAFGPLSRLTYAGYLSHEFVMYVYVYSRRDTIYLQPFSEVELFFGFVVVTYFVSAVASLIFEVPAMQLEKILRNKIENRKKNA